jgi:hypothetical protein
MTIFCIAFFKSYLSTATTWATLWEKTRCVNTDLILAVVVPLYAGILDSLAPAHGAGEVDALSEIRNELPA